MKPTSPRGIFRCACGAEYVTLRLADVRRGHVASCGCLQREKAAATMKKNRAAMVPASRLAREIKRADRLESELRLSRAALEQIVAMADNREHFVARGAHTLAEIINHAHVALAATAPIKKDNAA
jgi:hypothetical protein